MKKEEQSEAIKCVLSKGISIKSLAPVTGIQ